MWTMFVGVICLAVGVVLGSKHERHLRKFEVDNRKYRATLT